MAEVMTNEQPQQVLEPSLWSTLPISLVEKILSRTPWGTLMRFRAVSKSWNSDVVPRVSKCQCFSKSVLLWYDGMWEPALVHPTISRKLECSKNETWKTFHPSSFPPLSYATKETWRLSLVASEGGILFFQINRLLISQSGFLVWNPLTGKHRIIILPEFCKELIILSSCPVSFSAVVNVETGNYEILLGNRFSVDHVSVPRKFYNYKSLSRTWKEVPFPECDLALFSPQIPTNIWVRSSISWNGNIYLTLEDLTITLVAIVMMYDIEKEAWSKAKELINNDHSSTAIISEDKEGKAGEVLFVKMCLSMRRVGPDGELELKGLKLVRKLVGGNPGGMNLIDRLQQIVEENIHQDGNSHHEDVESIRFYYLGFRKESFYHMIYLGDVPPKQSDDLYEPSGFLRTIIHDTSEDSYIHSYQKVYWEFPGRRIYYEQKFFKFSPSLNAIV